MADEAVERRLAAILAADVVGYSRLMGKDEAGTLTRLRRARTELIQPLLQEHGGRLVKLMGDGLLVEFPSVVAAVTCAVAIQKGMAEREADLPADRRLQLRIGINVGDIIIEDDDIYGDGVNVAARLEAMAEPGGICVSLNVRDQVRDKLSFSFNDMGEHAVKNIARSVRAFRVLADGGSPPTIAVGRPRKWVGATTGAALALLLAIAIAGGGWWWLQGRDAPSGSRAHTTLEVGPSVAVLPFSNLSGDPDQDYFSDGLSEDLITDLSKLRGITVIARNSSFAFKGQSLDVREIGEKLGVRYLIEGSVRKAGERLRVNAQLIDAASGDHLWAERWDRPTSDIFAVQDELTRKIVATLDVKLSEGQQAQRWRTQTDDHVAYDLYLRGRAHALEQSRDGMRAAVPLLENAVARDPDFAAAWVWLGWAYWAHVYLGITEDADSYKRKAVDAANKATVADPNFGDPHMLLSEIALYDEDLPRATSEAQEAVDLDPGNADNLLAFALQLVSEDRADEGYEAIQRAFRLNPLPPAWYHNVHGQTLLALERFSEAEAAFARCLEMAPEFVTCYRYLTAMHLEAGNLDAARRTAKDVLRLLPEYSIAKHEFWHKQTKDPAERERRIELLKSAGLPE